MEIKKNLVEYKRKSLNQHKYNGYLGEEKKYKDHKINKSKKRKERIHSEIFKLININMEQIENKLDSNNINGDGILNINTSRIADFDNIQNYSGEKISIITHTNSNGQTIEKEDVKDNNNMLQKKDKEKIINNKHLSNENKIYKKPPNIKKLKNTEVMKNNNISNRIETKTEKDTIINNSKVEIINESSFKLDNNNSKEENENENENEVILTERKIENKIRNIFLYDNTIKSPQKLHNSLNDYHRAKINFKDNLKYSFSRNFSLFDSASTSDVYEKSKKKFKFHQLIDETCKSNIYLKYNKTELINFFSEINLPTVYANKFIENGFDDLDVILTLTRTSITITNQNLKDIGIKSAGHRAKILIHLEERAGIFPFYLEQNIIYNNNDNNNYLNNDSLFKFLSGIGCEKYVNNFRRNGYHNSEILFSQMLTRESITKKMLKDDVCIDSEYNISKIIKCLNVESKNYVKKLRKNKNINLIFDDKIYRDSCESCIIY